MNTDRFDTGKRFVLQTIFRNNRLDAYKKYIELALIEGYDVCSMLEFYGDKERGKHFVLRHDVDHKTPATYKMFRVEKGIGVHSTYYFRWSTVDRGLMKEMIDAGFEVGLHYETISDYAIKNNITQITDEDIEICRLRLKEEIAKFSKVINRPVSSIVGHGTKKNLEIRKSNNVLLEGESYTDYGIMFEGYDKDLYNKYVDVHIMDGSIRINNGFSYKSNPIDAISSGYRNIIFLTHPNHWYKTLPQRGWNVAMVAAGKCTFDTDREFSRILDE